VSPLQASVPLMQLLAERAKLALAAAVPRHLHAQQLAPPLALPAPHLPLALSVGHTAGELSRRLSARLHAACVSLVGSGEFGSGVSIAVAQRGATLASVAAGFRGAADPRAVLADTPMPLLELSCLLPALLLHSLEASGDLSLAQPIAEVWPAFGANGKEGLTISEALSHRVETRLDLGLVGGGWFESPASLADATAKWATLAGATLKREEDAEEASSGVFGDGAGSSSSSAGSEVLSHGWLLSAIAAAAADPSGAGEPDPATYLAALRDRLLAPLGIESGLWAGKLPTDKAEAAADVSSGFAAQMQGFAMLGGAAAGGGPEGGLGAGGGLPGGAAGARLLRDVPLGASVVNTASVRSGLLPGVGAFATAEALARLLGAAARGDFGPRGGLAAETWRCVATEHSPLLGRREWALGLQRFPTRAAGGGQDCAAVGLHSCGGSVALFWPRAQVSVAILLNEMSLDYAPTKALLELVTQELGLGAVEFVEDGLF